MRSGVFTLVAVGLVLVGCTVDTASESDLTRPTSTSTLGSTTSSEGAETSTSTVPDVSSATFDLLDGSELELVGPATLELGSYFFFLEVPDLGSSNVYVARDVEPEVAAAVEDAEFHSDVSEGVKLWMADREGEPVFVTVEVGTWLARLHVGWEAPPDTELLMSLADQLRGESSSRGVILPHLDVEEFRVSFEDSDSENQIQLWVGVCHQERIPGSEIIEHIDRGELIQKPGYASWCDAENDFEVSVYGDEDFVHRVVESLALTRTPLEASATDTTESSATAGPYDADTCATSFHEEVDVDTGAIRAPRDDERVMVSFQDADEWDGEYPVCWAAYTSTADGCHFFTLDIEGAYSAPQWLPSGLEDPPCVLDAYQEYPTPP
jgi:hypothetical protein